MKKAKLILAMALLAIPTVSFAHGSKVKVLQEGTDVALEQVQTQENDGTQERVTGVKSWFSGEAVRVRVYLTNNDTLEYHCAQPEHDAPFECHKM